MFFFNQCSVFQILINILRFQAPSQCKKYLLISLPGLANEILMIKVKECSGRSSDFEKYKKLLNGMESKLTDFRNIFELRKLKDERELAIARERYLIYFLLSNSHIINNLFINNNAKTVNK